MIAKISRIIIGLLDRFISPIVTKKEYRDQKYKWINERPIELSFTLRALREIYPRRILDVGSGLSSFPHLLANCGFLVTAIDNKDSYWNFMEMHNRHFYIINDDITSSNINYKFDFITCISTLEHIEYHNAAMRNMSNLIKDSGHIVLTFPYNEGNYIKNVYELEGADYGKDLSYICQIFSRKQINKWIEDNKLEIIEMEYWQVFDGEYWAFGNRLYPPKKVNKQQKHQLICLLLKKI